MSYEILAEPSLVNGLVKVDPGHEPHEGDEARAQGQEGEVVPVACPQLRPWVAQRNRIEIDVRMFSRSPCLDINQSLNIFLLLLDSCQWFCDYCHPYFAFGFFF